MKKDFDDCLELIKSKKIRHFTITALETAPKEFWTAPCSSSGKYHPPEDQAEGGIIIHTRKAVQVAVSLFRFFDIDNDLMRDMIIAAVILHDIHKNGIPWDKHTNYEHGQIAYDRLMEFAGNDPNLIGVCLLVKDHMAIWNQPNPTPALEINKKVSRWAISHLIVQMADYWASRKWCPFICNEILPA